MKDLLLSELQKIFLRKKAKSKIKILWSQNHKWIGRNKKSSLKLPFLGDGADTENRTRDLTLTKGALYQLSHISTIR